MLQFTGVQARTKRAILPAAVVLVCFTSSAMAAPVAGSGAGSYRSEETQIPKTPSAPPSLDQAAPENPFTCTRYFVYQGKPLACDSNARTDGERLRPIIQDVPAAVAELDTYQNNRRAVNNSAYVASVGLALVLVGFLISRPIIRDGSVKPGGYIAIPGGALAAGTFIYGLALSRTNERHLGRAAEEFNKVHPETPIELQFNAGIHF